MKYRIETHFGCNSNAIIVNGKNYKGEDPRYTLSDEERAEFEEALLCKLDDSFSIKLTYAIRKRWAAEEIGLIDLLNLLHPDGEDSSPTCETCGDNVTSTYYSF